MVPCKTNGSPYAQGHDRYTILPRYRMFHPITKSDHNQIGPLPKRTITKSDYWNKKYNFLDPKRTITKSDYWNKKYNFLDPKRTITKSDYWNKKYMNFNEKKYNRRLIGCLEQSLVIMTFMYIVYRFSLRPNYWVIYRQVLIFT